MQIDRKVTQPYMGVWPRVGAGLSHSGDRTFSRVFGSDPGNPHPNSYLFHYKTMWNILASGCKNCRLRENKTKQHLLITAEKILGANDFQWRTESEENRGRTWKIDE